MAGKVIWITGLSGAGKTTVGAELYKQFKEIDKSIVLFDGDKLREVFGGDLGYSNEDRFNCAMRYSRLCKMIAEQDINVICCTISMFHEIRKWNRENIENYYEVYLKVPMEILIERNNKGIYDNKSDVVGINLEFEEPFNSDLVVNNSEIQSILQTVNKIMNEFGIL